MTDVELKILYTLLEKYHSTYVGMTGAIEKLQNQIRIKCESRGISPDCIKDVKIEIPAQKEEDFVKLKMNNTIKDINLELQDVGVSFQEYTDSDDDFVAVEIDHNRIVNAKKLLNRNLGRSRIYIINWDDVNQMRANGMTYQAIYTQLGMSKSLFYKRLREHKQSK